MHEPAPGVAPCHHPSAQSCSPPSLLEYASLRGRAGGRTRGVGQHRQRLQSTTLAVGRDAVARRSERRARPIDSFAAGRQSGGRSPRRRPRRFERTGRWVCPTRRRARGAAGPAAPGRAACAAASECRAKGIVSRLCCDLSLLSRKKRSRQQKNGGGGGGGIDCRRGGWHAGVGCGPDPEDALSQERRR